MEICNAYRMGGKVGGNVSKEVYENYSDLPGNERRVMFEWMDTPLDNRAQELFGPHFCDEGESLASRMSRVQTVISKIFENQSVEKMMLDVNYLDGLAEREISLKYKEFKSTILKVYEEEDAVFAPVVRMYLNK